jgi:L-ascorbate oxidase
MSKRIHQTVIHLLTAGALAASLTAAFAAPRAVTAPPPLKAGAPPAAGRAITNPSVLSITPIVGGVPVLRALTAGAPPPATPGEKKLDLHVVFSPGKIYNPATDSWDLVDLRSYAQTANGITGELVAPTIPVIPGDTIHIVLHNDLQDDASCNTHEMSAAAMDQPHCFNGTNLHTHGLWVSPAGNGDNVLLSINPHQTFEYVINIPSDHPSGTFWYHTHRHGSTALQVASGMAGAIIIRGNRLPTPTKHGDIDTLLKEPGGAAMPEEVLVMQQIQYACLDDKGAIKVKMGPDPNNPGKQIVVAWVCDPGEVGTVGPYKSATGQMGYSDINGRGYSPGNWVQSGRYTSINGVVLPTWQAHAGQINRWRMIHAGIRDTISLQFYHMKPHAKLEGLAASDDDAFIAGNCTGEAIPYHIMAQDGLTTGTAQRTTLATLQPGYRVDALVMFPSSGDYCVVDASSPLGSNISRVVEPRRLLGKVTVDGTAHVADIDAELKKQLIAAAQRTMPVNVRAAVIADLQNGLRLTSFVPHPAIEPDEVTGHQYLTFNIDTSTAPTQYEVGTNTKPPSANPSPDPDKNYPPRQYDPARIDRHLILGGVDEWTLQSLFVSHPFHIHVNPFEIIDILDPTGKDVSGPDAIDDYALDPSGNPIKGTPDPQYRGLKGTFKDTLWVKNINPNSNPTAPKGIYTLIVRTRYERYIGEFVLHCHILDHEDQGMMQNVSIGLAPYTAPGAAMDGMGH